MPEPKVAPYGSWKSPITTDLIVTETVWLQSPMLDGQDIYWIEVRPAEAGRYVIVKRNPDGKTTDVTPKPFSARTTVHEYGGGAYLVVDGTVYFSNFSDQRLYRQDPGSNPKPITPALDLRYADSVFDRERGRLICVREDHTQPGEAVNTLVTLDVNKENGGQVIVCGDDFYSSPRLSADGSRLAWLTWNHPNMPWDGTELWVGDFSRDGTLTRSQKVAGGRDESIFQPEWSPEGMLHFVSDRTGWWNLYRWRNGNVEPLYGMQAEFGRPQWVLGRGMSTYDFESGQRIVCSYYQRGAWHLARLAVSSSKLTPIGIPYTEIWGLRVVKGTVLFIGGSPTEFTSIVKMDLETGRSEVLRRESNVIIDSSYLSVPREIEYPTENGLTAFAFFYAPMNRDHRAPTSEKPPLIVISHGGPTGATSTIMDLETQYWTSRGFAVLDVNYGGSTGYGRPYRQRLNGQWGVVDVDDCVNGALYLVKRGEADVNRLIIRGGSAGGYTTLAALTFRNVFKAGASYFGIGDLEPFVKETHKFESRYLTSLLGPYPQKQDLYHERSPIHFTDRLSCPIILFQGLEDKIVPPNQAEMMYNALRRKGMPVAYFAFEGEQHGFRKAQTIKRCLEAELYFYSKVFGFEPADHVEEVPIENMP